jgi:hypothetical protein
MASNWASTFNKRDFSLFPVNFAGEIHFERDLSTNSHNSTTAMPRPI